MNVERGESGSENNAALIEMVRELRQSNAESQETARQAMEKVGSMAELVAKLSSEVPTQPTNEVDPELEQQRQAYQEGLGELRATTTMLQQFAERMLTLLEDKDENIAQIQPTLPMSEVIALIDALGVKEGMVGQFKDMMQQGLAGVNSRIDELRGEMQAAGSQAPITINNNPTISPTINPSFENNPVNSNDTLAALEQSAEQAVDTINKVTTEGSQTSINLRSRLMRGTAVPTVNPRVRRGRPPQRGEQSTPEPETETSTGPLPLEEDGWADNLPPKPAKGIKWWYVENAGGKYAAENEKKNIKKGDPKDRKDIRKVIYNNTLDDLWGSVEKSVSRQNALKSRLDELLDGYFQRWQSGESTAEERYRWIESLRKGEFTQDI